MFHVSRWKRPTIASGVALSVLAISAALSPQAIAAGKTITAVMHSDLRVIDPGLTTAYITRDHGYMVYDTLVATDSELQGPAADGGLEGQRRQAHLHLHPARRPEMA